MALFKRQVKKAHGLLNYINYLSIPTVAAIKGCCFGAGLEIALSSHIRFCTSTAVLSLPESNLGLLPGLGGSVRLPELAGLTKSIEILIQGDTIDSQTALTYGIVDHVVPDKDVLKYSVDYLNKITKGKPISVINSIMKSLHHQRNINIHSKLDFETKLFCNLLRQYKNL